MPVAELGVFAGLVAGVLADLGSFESPGFAAKIRFAALTHLFAEHCNVN